MIIEKMREKAGWFQARTMINGEVFVGCSDSKIDALERLFRKLQWAEIGNWNHNG